jgi:hypothetical protein
MSVDVDELVRWYRTLTDDQQAIVRDLLELSFQRARH